MRNAEPIGMGRAAKIFLWQNNSVLKLFDECCTLGEVEKEAQIGRLIHESGLPAPKIIETIHYEGKFGIVLEYIPGPTMLEIVMQTPLSAFKMFRLLAELHASIHQHSIHSLPSQRQIMITKIQRADGLSASTREKVLSIVGNLPEGQQICHGDFHPDNVIMSPRGPIIIDWANSTQGNPLADFARTVLMLKIGQPPPGQQINLFLRLTRKRLTSHYVKCYRQKTDLDTTSFNAFMLMVAAARLTEEIEEETESLLTLIDELLQSI